MSLGEDAYLVHTRRQVWIRASDRGDKIWSKRQRFLMEINTTHKWNVAASSPRVMSLRLVA